MTAIQYRPLMLGDIQDVSELHLSTLQEGLLYALGRSSLIAFYQYFVKDKGSFGFVALDGKSIVGCVIATANIKRVYLSLLCKPSFALSLVMHLRDIFRVPVIFAPRLPKAELVSLFSHQDYRGKGIASHLVALVDKEFKKRHVKEYFLDVMHHNVPANAFYRKRGYEYLTTLKRGKDARNVYIRHLAF